MRAGFTGIVLLERYFVMWNEKYIIHISCYTYLIAVTLSIKQRLFVSLLCTGRYWQFSGFLWCMIYCVN